MKHIITASLFALAVAGVTVTAQGAPTAPAQPSVTGPSELLQEAASNSYGGNHYNNHYQSSNNHYNRYDNHHMRHSWDYHRDGRRCHYRSDYCSHYYHGYWYQTPWWTLPLIGGAVVLGLDNNHHSHHHNSYH